MENILSAQSTHGIVANDAAMLLNIGLNNKGWRHFILILPMVVDMKFCIQLTTNTLIP